MQLQRPSFNLVSASATYFEGARRLLVLPPAAFQGLTKLPAQVLLPEPSARRASRNSPKDLLPTSGDCSTWPAVWRHRQHTAWPWQMTTLCMWHALVVSAVLQHARAIGVSLHLIPRPRAPSRLVLFMEASPTRAGRSDEASILHEETLHAGLFGHHLQEATQQASSCRPTPHLQQRELLACHHIDEHCHGDGLVRPARAHRRLVLLHPFPHSCFSRFAAACPLRRGGCPPSTSPTILPEMA